MVYAVDPISSPVGFMITYFLTNFTNESVLVAVKLGLMASVYIFPFAIVGRYIHEKFIALKVKARPSVQVLATTFVMVIAFWIVSHIWYSIFNPTFKGFFTEGLFEFIKSLIIIIIAVFLFALLARWVYRKMKAHWKMPDVFRVYITELLMCILGWVLVCIWFIITMQT